jgi:hypothetical protein
MAHTCNLNCLESEIGRITVSGQLGTKSSGDPVSTEKAGHGDTCQSFQLLQKAYIGKSWSRPARGKEARPISKMSRTKRAGSMAQAVEHL